MKTKLTTETITQIINPTLGVRYTVRLKDESGLRVCIENATNAQMVEFASIGPGGNVLQNYDGSVCPGDTALFLDTAKQSDLDKQASVDAMPADVS